MTEPLATSDNVEDRLGRALTTEESQKIDALILDASASVVAYTGQTFAEEETTDLLPIRNRAVRLPLRPVTAVAAVEDGNGNTLPFSWIVGDSTISFVGSGFLNEWELNILPGTRVGKALVTYTHGYSTIPDDVVAVVCRIVGRAIATPLDEAGATISESITNYSETRTTPSGSGTFSLLPDEKLILDRYRVLAGPAMML